MFDIRKLATFKSTQIHQLFVLGFNALTVRVKVGFDTNNNRKPDVFIHVTTAGSVDIFKETYDLPNLDEKNPVEVFNFVIAEIEKRGIDIPGVGDGA